MFFKYSFFSLLIFLNACTSTAQAKKVKVARNVSVEKYIGHWYAVTSLPQFFTRSCVGQTAEYEILSSQKISVLNTCLKVDGKTKTISGSARVMDPPNNAILEVQFDNFWTNLFNVKGDYVIFKLDSKYRYALVGSRNLKSLWLLSRTPSVPDQVYDAYIGYAEEIGFNVDKLIDSKF